LIHPAIPLALARERLHFLLVGGSGSGKTQVIHRLILSAAARQDQQLIYDFKGDLTSEYYDSENTILLAPWDARSARWDIAADVPNIAAARELAAALIPLPETSDAKWASGGRQILTGLIVALQAAQPGQWSIHDLARAVSADGETLAATLRTYFPEAAHLLINPDQNPAVSYISSLTDYLAPVHDLARMWPHDATERWSVRRWLEGHERRRVIVGHNQGQADLAQFLLRAVLRLVLQRVGSPEFTAAAVPTWLFLDEFLQAGKIDSILSIAETARSKDVRVVLACQDFSRVKDIYGHDPADALAGTLGTVLIGRSRGETAQWASRLAGEKQLDRFRASASKSGGTTNWDRVSEPVMRPEAFDATLGTIGRGKKLTNRLLMLAGGDTIGRIDWPLYRPPVIAEAHVPAQTLPPAESADAPQPAPAASHDVGAVDPNPIEPDARPAKSESQSPKSTGSTTEYRIDKLRRLRGQPMTDSDPEAG
jgi:hypothetical protein